MIKNFKFKILNSEKGISLVEVLVSIFIIALFSTILISDFPRIKKQFALSRGAYKLAQDLRKTEDLGLSGVQISGYEGQEINAKGYGIYASSTEDSTKYIIYADRGDTPDQQFGKDDSNSYLDCNEQDDSQVDCVVESIDIELGVFIKEIYKVDGDLDNTSNIDWASINFSPPNPTVTIVPSLVSGESGIAIVLGLNSDSGSKTVYINTSGLIQIK